MQWFAQAPSNIALIKYMGKVDTETNTPVNSSLSYTLNDLLSFVELETHTGKHDTWEPLDIPGSIPFQLDKHSQERFLKHLGFIKQHYQYTGHFTVRSCNNFPHGTGLASSASSFAALTLCAIRALSELTKQPEPSIADIAQLSRQGSGSSCRSFFTPWALWTRESIEAIHLPYDQLIHHVVIGSHEPKAVSSSQAHQRIRTSPLFEDREKRAEQRLQELLNALKQKDWQNAFQIVWDEFHDMHKLFETAEQPFYYMNDASHQILNYLAGYWEKHADGPLVTMDAGPNVHLLFRPDQKNMMNQMQQECFIGNFDVI